MERPFAPQPVVAQQLAVISGEENERVFRQACAIEGFENTPHFAVDEPNHGVVVGAAEPCRFFAYFPVIKIDALPRNHKLTSNVRFVQTAFARHSIMRRLVIQLTLCPVRSRDIFRFHTVLKLRRHAVRVMRVLKANGQQEGLRAILFLQKVNSPIRSPDTVVIPERRVPVARISAEARLRKHPVVAERLELLIRHLRFHPMPVMMVEAVRRMPGGHLNALEALIGGVQGTSVISCFIRRSIIVPHSQSAPRR